MTKELSHPSLRRPEFLPQAVAELVGSEFWEQPVSKNSLSSKIEMGFREKSK